MTETANQTPFSILTGFLGAGKTTVLNRVLSRPQGKRIAVLVNELGRVAIDSKLIVARGGDVLELAGGCVCCKVGDDLWDGIVDVIRRSKPDHVVLETTGIAEPQAILDGLEVLPDGYRDRIALAGVVCVVDARAAVDQVERHEEARSQLETADRMMLSKLDLADADQVAATRSLIAQVNPGAETAAFPRTEPGTAALVPWLLERRRRTGPRVAKRHVHGAGQLVAVAFTGDQPMLAEPVMDVLHQLGDRLVRAKGYLRVAGQQAPAYVELAGGELSLRSGVWPDGSAQTSELVLIGEELDESAILRQLWACTAGGEA